MTPDVNVEEPIAAEWAESVPAAVREPPTLVSDSLLPLWTSGEPSPLADGRRLSAAWREALNRRLLALADVVGACVTLVVLLNAFGQRRVAALVFAGAALVMFLFKVAGLYDRDDLRIVHSTIDEMPLLAQMTGLFALGIAILQSVVLAGSLSGTRIAAIWVASFAAIVCGRVAARGLARRSSPPERCLIIGEQTEVRRIRAKLAASRACADVVATLPLPADGGLASGPAEIPGIMRAMVTSLSVHRIIIAPATADARPVVDLIRVAKAVGAKVTVLPRMFEVVGSFVEFDDVDGMTMLGLKRFGLSRSSRALKRSFDIAVGGAVLVLCSPLLAAIAMAIMLDSRGPVLFSQVRVGRNGGHFRILKFRSMVTGADARKDQLRSINEAGSGLFKIGDDPRVTRVGRFLRRASLDELPQLINVLRGEMSLVGPRPLVVDEDAQVVGLDRSRLHLTPGMTGPWQVLGSRVPMQEMVALDYLYVAGWTLWLDVKLLLRTARHVLRRGNS